MSFDIVKHAISDTQKYYFKTDPQLGVVASYSCHDTFSGRQSSIKERYENLDEAEKDCVKINTANPVGTYAVCPLI